MITNWISCSLDGSQLTNGTPLLSVVYDDPTYNEIIAVDVSPINKTMINGQPGFTTKFGPATPDAIPGQVAAFLNSRVAERIAELTAIEAMIPPVDIRNMFGTVIMNPNFVPVAQVV